MANAEVQQNARSSNIKIVVSVLYILTLALAVISLIRNGFAHAGNGKMVSDSWIFVSFVAFFVITIIQALLYHMKKDKYKIYGLVLAPIKFIFVFIFELVVDIRYVFSYGYMTNNSTSGFYSNIWYTIMVAIFLGLILTTGIMEVIGCVDLKKITK